MKFIVTGGSGFIGSALIRFLISETDHDVLNIDKLTYAGNTHSIQSVSGSSIYEFLKADICDRKALIKAFSDFQPDRLVHLAAESHVDRSLDNPKDFIHTNITGTFNLLETAREYWSGVPGEQFLFHHVSTDEVFGSLGEEGSFSETSPYRPRSPYSASKASSDHLARAWCETYGLPVVVSNCSNNYGPYQFPEKLIPLMIVSALNKRKLPIYGHGKNVRDWLYVDDHAQALYSIATEGKAGQTYNVGGEAERTNLEVVRTICDLLQKKAPLDDSFRYDSLISFVEDRPGHDYRYSINPKKIKTELGWVPKESFETGMEKTVNWYLENEQWYKSISGDYDQERLGLS